MKLWTKKRDNDGMLIHAQSLSHMVRNLCII